LNRTVVLGWKKPIRYARRSVDSPMILEFLINNPLVLLFVVAGVGYPLGRVRIRGASLGVAAVLFTGLAAGALHPDLKLPEILPSLGLVLFVYTVGLTNGAGFFASFRRQGLRDSAFIFGALLAAAGLVVLVRPLLAFSAGASAGLFAGSLTNTPALAAVLDVLRQKGIEPDAAVVAYSMAYPFGVLGMILAIAFAQRLWKVDYTREARAVEAVETVGQRLQVRTVRVTNPESGRMPVAQLCQHHGLRVVFGRMQRAGNLSVVSGETVLQVGDLVSVVGTTEELERVTECVGEMSDVRLENDRSRLDYRRMFVSNRAIAGHRLRHLHLPNHLGAVVTRVRRGDVELLPNGETVLELGDRVRVLAPRDRLEAHSRFFGDSYRALSEVDILTFSLGLALGLCLGLVPIPIPGGIVLRLGIAGGPLVAALLLGALGRTGPLLWNLPYSANLTLRQIGLILFLAGIGTRSGFAFWQALRVGSGWGVLVAGAVITLVVALGVLWFGHRVLRIPFGTLTGMLAGLQTQPAVLGFAVEQSGNDLPNVGYARVYPLATVAKILLAQLLVGFVL
jgi:putative transport protein